MLQLTDLALRRGPRALLEHVDITVHRGQRVGLTGANGSGKSSLFALIRGEIEADAGSCSLPPGLRIGHVAQETAASAEAVLAYVIAGDDRLNALKAALEQAQARGDGEAEARLHGELDSAGAYTAEARAARILAGLGFSPEAIARPVAEFSGGWRVRIALARALMCPSDLLLLDEPTNHLDLDAVVWLGGWLRSYQGTLLLISHDRDFLDEVVTHIAHIENRTLTLYTGDYSSFERRRAEMAAAREATRRRQQAEVARIQSFVDRFKAKATKARQAQSRIKMLEKMELIAPAHVETGYDFEFHTRGRLPDPLLTLDDCAAGYGDTPVLKGLRVQIRPGDRIGLLGANGAGKSTLVKLLAGEIAPLDGKRLPAPGLVIGYFAQHQIEQLDLDASPLTHLARIAPNVREQALRDHLGGFGFAGDRASDPVAPFSGGEKARLVLALLAWQRPQLLLLDEPTNHLDLEMRYALERALQDFDGALLIVSHDRHLIRSSADDLWLVADGGAREFDGDLADYARWLASRGNDKSEESTLATAGAHTAASRQNKRRREAGLRQAVRPLKKEVDRLEKALHETSTIQKQCEIALADPDIYADNRKDELLNTLGRRTQAEQRLNELETAWLDATSRLEEMEAALGNLSES